MLRSPVLRDGQVSDKPKLILPLTRARVGEQTPGLLVVLEGLLSADNAMVIAVQVLGLPKADQQKALRYGLVGAFIVRAIATLLATLLIRVGWVKLVGAFYLLYLVWQQDREADTLRPGRSSVSQPSN